VGLFRPYEPGTPADPTATPVPPAAAPVGAADAAVGGTTNRPARKTLPTPSRREAEAARRLRLNPVRTKKEAKAYERAQQATARQKSLAASEARPELVLLRDYVDARWNLAEFVLPVMIVILALSMMGNLWAPLVVITMIATWSLLALVLVDLTILWRGFKKVLGERYPRSSPKGLLMLTVNRAMQMRRFRQPPARIKRGQDY